VTKKLLIQTVTLENLCKTLLCEKGAHKMLIKLTPDRVLALLVELEVGVGHADAGLEVLVPVLVDVDLQTFDSNLKNVGGTIKHLGPGSI